MSIQSLVWFLPVVIYGCELDHKESWVPKNWCFQTVELKKTLESSLDCKEIKPVNPKGNQPWIFIGRTDAKAEAPILWPPDMKSQLIGKDPDSGKDWGQKEKTGWQRMSWLDSITNLMDMNLSKFQKIVEDRGVCCATGHGVAKSLTQLSNWTTRSGRETKKRGRGMAGGAELKPRECLL